MASANRSRTKALQLKVTLAHVDPAIWRRIQVPDNFSLIQLHVVIQVAMGWTDSHLHEFEVNGVRYGIPDPDWGGSMKDERRTRLRSVLKQTRTEALYTYDFGDGWEHVIEVEAITEPDPDVKLPRCLDGARSCPPEDVGGAWGYEEFLDALQDEDHPEHEDYLEWASEFDPEAFDLASVNQRLRSIRWSIVR